MGKATIISGGQNGKYVARIDRHRHRVVAEIAKIDAENQEIAVRLPEIEAELSTAQDKTRTMADRLDAAIADLALVTPGTEGHSTAMAEVKKRQAEAAAATQNVVRLSSVRRVLQVRQAANNARRAYLQDNAPEEEIGEVWCADLNEDITGEVGTMEIGSGKILIRPAGVSGDAAAYAPERDGQIQPVVGSTPAAAFFNYALLPGAEKWRPRYRAGVITEMDENSCTVQIFHTTATHQGLSVNQGELLQNVPITYLDCDGDAFFIGDRVVVEFVGQNFSAPRVIGFLDNPMPCEERLSGFICVANGYKVVDIDENGQYLVKVPSFAPQYGNIDWQGPNGLVLSWVGGSRYFDQSTTGSQVLYRSGRPFVVLPPEYVIFGAAIAGGKIVIVTQPYIYAAEDQEMVEQFLFADLFNPLELRVGHVQAWPGEKVVGRRNSTPWIFSENGTKAVVKRKVGDTYNYYRATINPATETVTISEGERCGDFGTRHTTTRSQNAGTITMESKAHHKFIEFDGNREYEGWLNFDFLHVLSAQREDPQPPSYSEQATIESTGSIAFTVDGNLIYSKDLRMQNAEVSITERNYYNIPQFMAAGYTPGLATITHVPYDFYARISFSFIDCRTRAFAACFDYFAYDHSSIQVIDERTGTINYENTYYSPENAFGFRAKKFTNTWEQQEETMSYEDQSGMLNHTNYTAGQMNRYKTVVDTILGLAQRNPWPDGWQLSFPTEGFRYMPGYPHEEISLDLLWVSVFYDAMQGKSFPHPKDKSQFLCSGHKNWDYDQRTWQTPFAKISNADATALLGDEIAPATIGVV